MRAVKSPFLAELPAFRHSSPQVVIVCDRIRFELDAKEELAEFCYFAREYPRCYRFHMDAAEFRLKSVHSLLAALKSDLCERQEAAHPDTYSLAVSNLKMQEVYWDFESFLSEVSIALDLLARVIGPAFTQESPPTRHESVPFTDF